VKRLCLSACSQADKDDSDLESNQAPDNMILDLMNLSIDLYYLKFHPSNQGWQAFSKQAD